MFFHGLSPKDSADFYHVMSSLLTTDPYTTRLRPSNTIVIQISVHGILRINS